MKLISFNTWLHRRNRPMIGWSAGNLSFFQETMKQHNFIRIGKYLAPMTAEPKKVALANVSSDLVLSSEEIVYFAFIQLNTDTPFRVVYVYRKVKR